MVDSVVHLFRNHDVAVGTGRPGYRWAAGYSSVTRQGVSNSMTRRNWQAMARRDGFKLRFHDTEDAARKEALTAGDATATKRAGRSGAAACIHGQEPR